MMEDQIPQEKPKTFKQLLELFQFKWERDSISEARSTLLIVVALILTVTFQAGINPPTLLIGKDYNPNNASIIAFSVVNTIAFSASGGIVTYLTGGLPFHRELSLALVFMGASYGCAVINTRLAGIGQVYAVIFSLLVPQFVRWGPALVETIVCSSKAYNRM